MTRLAEPTLRLTALTGWVAPHRHGTWDMPAEPDLFGATDETIPTRAGWTLHWASLSPADDTTQGTAACGQSLDRDAEWWRASPHALAHAARSTDDLWWQFCGPCVYWAGGLP